VYDKSLYDRLRDGDAPAARKHLARPIEQQRHEARFTENHDEPRAAVQFGPRAQPAAVLTYLSAGLKLFHEGQLEGRRVKVPVQLARRPAETPDGAAVDFYRRLLEILDDPAFLSGTFASVTPLPAGTGDASHESLVAFHRRAAEAPASDPGWLVVANLGPTPARGRLLCPAGFDAQRTYVLADRLTGARYDRDGAGLSRDGVYVELEPWASQVFRLDP
jgi:hypothetical protein